jgi:PIN domain nuclease of toxin-antitoxin system
MKLLLDTHIWLWSVLEPTRLSKRIARAIDNRESQLWLSPISIWKLLMLTQKGRGQLNEDAGTWARRTVDQLQLHEAPLTFEVAWKHPRRASATAILRTVSSRLRPKSLI